MAEPTAAHARELGDYLLVARRRWRWIAGGAVVGLVLALVYLQVAQLTYASTATLQVEATAADASAEGDRTNDAINLDTEAQLVRSNLVAERAAAKLGSDETPRRLASRVTVTVPPNTTVLAITYRGPSAEDAQRGAQAFAEAYLENRRDAAQEVLTSDEERLQAQIEQTEKEIRDASVAIAGLTGPDEQAQRAFFVAQRANLNAQLNSFQNQLAPVAGAEVRPGQIITEPSLPRTPVDPNPLLVLPSGLMAGVLVGVVLAGVRERRDKRIHTAVDLERVFGLKPLARMPWADGSLAHPSGVRLDADVRAVYHSLRANGPVTAESVIVVAPEATLVGERLSMSLAVVAARAGSSTAYVTRPGQASAADRRVAASANGLLSLPDYASIDAMVGGELHASALTKRLRTLRSKHDFLVLGLPTDDPVVDLPLLGRQVDVAVVLVALGRTERTSVESVLSSITKSGVDHVAVVVLDKPHRRARHRAQPLSVITEDSGPRGDDPDTGALPDATSGTDQGAHPHVGERADTRGGVAARNGSTGAGSAHGKPRKGGVRPVVRPAGGEVRS